MSEEVNKEVGQNSKGKETQAAGSGCLIVIIMACAMIWVVNSLSGSKILPPLTLEERIKRQDRAFFASLDAKIRKDPIHVLLPIETLRIIRDELSQEEKKELVTELRKGMEYQSFFRYFNALEEVLKKQESSDEKKSLLMKAVKWEQQLHENIRMRRNSEELQRLKEEQLDLYIELLGF